MDLKEKDGIRGCSLKRTVLGEEWMTLPAMKTSCLDARR